MDSHTNTTAQNRLLQTLPGLAAFEIERLSTRVSLKVGAILYDVNEKLDHIYFPVSGIASLQILLKAGRGVDTALVGRDGALGLIGMTDARRSKTRCVVRSDLVALRVTATAFSGAAACHPLIDELAVRYSEHLLFQTQVNAACYACLPVDIRLSLCLLEVAGLFPDDKIPLTQETLAEILAVRRTSVTAAAQKLQNLQIIDYSRGVITILDRARLSKLAHPTAPVWSDT